jgi:hypothetical protein
MEIANTLGSNKILADLCFVYEVENKSQKNKKSECESESE